MAGWQYADPLAMILLENPYRYHQQKSSDTTAVTKQFEVVTRAVTKGTISNEALASLGLASAQFLQL